MTKSTKVLLWVLGILIVIGGGIYLYFRNYGVVGADELAPSDEISVVSTMPRDNSYKYKCKSEDQCNLFVRYSSNVKGRITAANVALSKETATSTPPVEVKVDFPNFTNYAEGSVLRIKAQTRIEEGKIYQLSINAPILSGSANIEPVNIRFVAALGQNPTIGDILAFGLGLIIDSDFSGMTVVEIINTVNQQVIDTITQVFPEHGGRIDFSTIINERGTGTTPRNVSYRSSEYDSGVYTARATVVNSNGRSQTRNQTVVHIKGVKLAIAARESGVYNLSANRLMGPEGVLANKKIRLNIDGGTTQDGKDYTTTNANGDVSFNVVANSGQIRLNVKGYADMTELLTRLQVKNYLDHEFLVFDNDFLLR